MNISKNIVGWVLLIGGIALIAWTLISSYNIFTGKAEIPGIFKTENSSLSSASAQNGSQDLQVQLNKALGEQLKNLIPTDTIPKVLNLSVWSMLAFILIFGGAKISEIGIKLLNNK